VAKQTLWRHESGRKRADLFSLCSGLFLSLKNKRYSSVLLVAHFFFFCLNTSLSQPLQHPPYCQKNDRDTLTQKQKRIASGINITALSSFFFLPKGQRRSAEANVVRIDGHEKLKDRCRLRTADIERIVHSRRNTTQTNTPQKRISVRLMILFLFVHLGCSRRYTVHFVVV
jgi:hypothetical protein